MLVHVTLWKPNLNNKIRKCVQVKEHADKSQCTIYSRFIMKWKTFTYTVVVQKKPNVGTTWMDVTANFLLYLLHRAYSIPTFVQNNIFIHLAPINNLITWNYFVHSISNRLLLLEGKKMRDGISPQIFNKIKHHSVRKGQKLNYQFQPQMLPISTVIVWVPPDNLFFQYLPPRTKNFPFFPYTNLQVHSENVTFSNQYWLYTKVSIRIRCNKYVASWKGQTCNRGLQFA